MTIYHLSISTVGRSAGRSATAAAAYRCAALIRDERDGQTHDYRRKRGVVSTDLLLPPGAPAWTREQLWNAVEAAERRKDSTVAREFEIALPAELTADQRRDLALAFAGELVAKHGMAADVAIHEPNPDGDERNDHAHILCSTRRVGPDGLGEKTRELDLKTSGMVAYWRERWERLCNAALEAHGHEARIDHRSHAARGIDTAPSVHLGPTCTAIERRTGAPSQVRERATAQAGAQMAAAAAAEAEGDVAVAEAEVSQLASALAAAEAEAVRLAAAAIEHAQRTAAEAAPPVQLAEAAARRQAEATARQAAQPAPDAQQQYAHQVEEHARRVEYARRVEAWREQTLAQLLRLEWAQQEAPTAARQQRARQDLPTADAEHLRAQQHLLEARKRLRAQRWWNFMSLWRALRAQQQMPELEHRVRSWARAVEQLETLLHATPRERVEAAISEIRAQLLANPVPEVPPPPLPPAPTQAPHQAPSDAPEPPRPRPRLQ